jgi:hypothetical protein
LSKIENFFTKRATDFTRGVPTQSWDSYFGVGEKSTGYFIECDLDFTDKCKNKLIDFPPAPDHMKVSFDELSPFARNAHIKSTGYFDTETHHIEIPKTCLVCIVNT